MLGTAHPVAVAVFNVPFPAAPLTTAPFAYPVSALVAIGYTGVAAELVQTQKSVVTGMVEQTDAVAVRQYEFVEVEVVIPDGQDEVGRQ